MKRLFGGDNNNDKPSNGQGGIGQSRSSESEQSSNSTSGLGFLGLGGGGGGGQNRPKAAAHATPSASVIASDPKAGPTAEQKFLAELSIILSEEEEQKRQQELKAQALAIAGMDGDGENAGETSEVDSSSLPKTPLEGDAEPEPFNMQADMNELSEDEEEERRLQQELKAQALAIARIENDANDEISGAEPGAEPPGDSTDFGDFQSTTKQLDEVGERSISNSDSDNEETTRNKASSPSNSETGNEAVGISSTQSTHSTIDGHQDTGADEAERESSNIQADLNELSEEEEEELRLKEKLKAEAFAIAAMGSEGTKAASAEDTSPLPVDDKSEKAEEPPDSSSDFGAFQSTTVPPSPGDVPSTAPSEDTEKEKDGPMSTPEALTTNHEANRDHKTPEAVSCENTTLINSNHARQQSDDSPTEAIIEAPPVNKGETDVVEEILRTAPVSEEPTGQICNNEEGAVGAVATNSDLEAAVITEDEAGGSRSGQSILSLNVEHRSLETSIEAEKAVMNNTGTVQNNATGSPAEKVSCAPAVEEGETDKDISTNEAQPLGDSDESSVDSLKQSGIRDGTQSSSPAEKEKENTSDTIAKNGQQPIDSKRRELADDDSIMEEARSSTQEEEVTNAAVEPVVNDEDDISCKKDDSISSSLDDMLTIDHPDEMNARNEAEFGPLQEQSSEINDDDAPARSGETVALPGEGYSESMATPSVHKSETPLITNSSIDLTRDTQENNLSLSSGMSPVASRPTYSTEREPGFIENMRDHNALGRASEVVTDEGIAEPPAILNNSAEGQHGDQLQKPDDKKQLSSSTMKSQDPPEVPIDKGKQNGEVKSLAIEADETNASGQHNSPDVGEVISAVPEQKIPEASDGFMNDTEVIHGEGNGQLVEEIGKASAESTELGEASVTDDELPGDETPSLDVESDGQMSGGTDGEVQIDRDENEIRQEHSSLQQQELGHGTLVTGAQADTEPPTDDQEEEFSAKERLDTAYQQVVGSDLGPVVEKGIAQNPRSDDADSAQKVQDEKKLSEPSNALEQWQHGNLNGSGSSGQSTGGHTTVNGAVSRICSEVEKEANEARSDPASTGHGGGDTAVGGQTDDVHKAGANQEDGLAEAPRRKPSSSTELGNAEMSNVSEDINAGSDIEDTMSSEYGLERTDRHFSKQNDILDEFRELKHSFQRLLAATSSTVATASEVTAPALADARYTVASSATGLVQTARPAFTEAGNAVASSATDLVGTCRREFERRKSERNLIVSFVQDGKSAAAPSNQDTDWSEKTEDSAVLPAAHALSSDSVEADVPANLVLSSPTSANEYKHEVSRYLVDKLVRDEDLLPEEPNKTARASSKKGPGEGVSKTWTDPVLKAAVAGAAARSHNQEKHHQKSPAFPVRNEWTSALNRFAKLTASTTRTAASIAAPALREFRGTAAELARNRPGDRSLDEETILLSNKVADNPLSKHRENSRVYDAKQVAFDLISASGNNQTSDTGSLDGPMAGRSPFSIKHDQILKPCNQAPKMNDPSREMHLGKATPGVVDGTRTPASAERYSTASNLSVEPKAPEAEMDAFENPKRFMHFLSKKLQAHATEHFFRPQKFEEASNSSCSFDPRYSVFANERISRDSSSLSSPGSPEVMSASSSSSENYSMSTSLSAVDRSVLPEPAVAFWDMISENHQSSVVSSSGASSPRAKGRSVTTRNFQPRLSFDEAPSGIERETDRPVCYSERSDENDHSTTRMETHVEHPDESERSFGVDSSMEVVTPTRKNYAAAETQELAILEDSKDMAGADHETDQSESLTDQEMTTPPGSKPVDGMDLDLAAFSLHSNGSMSNLSRRNVATGGKRASVAKRRQRQADKRSEQVLGAKAAKSSDMDFDENGSFSGNTSLPGNHFGELVHVVSKHDRERPLGSTMSSPQRSPQTSVNWATNSSLARSESTLSGSKKGSSYSARKKTNRRSSLLKRNASLRLDGSGSLLPKSGQFQVTGIQRSLSGNDLLLLPTDESEPSISFPKGDVPEFDDISGAEEGTGMLDLALVTFSSVANSTLGDEAFPPKISKPARYLASVRWRQLLSNWKHTALASSLTERACSFHYIRDEEDHELSDDEGSTMSSSCVVKTRHGSALDLLRTHQKERLIHPETKNLNGLLPHLADGEMLTLTGFMVEFGRCPARMADARSEHQQEAPLAHILPDSIGDSVGGLTKLAASNLENFASLMHDIVHFAAQNHATTSDSYETEVSYSVGIKSREAIEKKAQRKYHGDVLQVKDILRAQITCGDEGSLVAGLLHLNRLCQRSERSNSDDFFFSIVRVKNLFQKNPSGELCSSLLPTGYRHILVNLRLKNLLVAEIQFQLAEVFDILGYEGYELHQEINEVEEACGHSYRTKPSQEYSKSEAQTKEDANGVPNNSADIDSQPESQENGVRSSTASATISAKGESVNTDAQPRPEEGATANHDVAKEVISQEKHYPPEDGTSKTDTTGDTNYSANDPLERPSETVDAAESDQASDSFHPFENLNRHEYIEELRKSAKDYTRRQLLTAIRTYAIDMAASKTRDVPTFHCLHFVCMLEAGYNPESAGLLGHGTDANVWPLFCPERFSPSYQEEAVGSGSQHEGGKTYNGSNATMDKILQISRECLLRSLAITNQGTSVGMTGWLEYGSDNSFGRIANSPFETLHQLACNFAYRNDWNGAVDVLEALVARCEQHLPLYHPITLSAMLDLAGAARKTSNTTLESNLIATVAKRLAFYLSEEETLFFKNIEASSGANGSSSAVAVLRFDNGIDGISMLRSFVEIFGSQARRDFLQILCDADGGNCNEKFINLCFLADAMSVLANCMLAGEAMFGASPDAAINSRYYWQAAYNNYEFAFRGWIENKHGLDDDCVFSAAYGIARCLRELGQRKKSVQILSSVVSALDLAKARSSFKNGRNAQHELDVESTVAAEGEPLASGKEPSSTTISFLPSRHVESRRLFLMGSDHQGSKVEQSMALCLWLMAAFSVEDSPDERGRIRALSLLHAASEALQSVIMPIQDGSPSSSEGVEASEKESLSYKQTCIDILNRIEREAKHLLEPWEFAAAEATPQAPSTSKGVNKKELRWLRDDHPSVSV